MYIPKRWLLPGILSVVLIIAIATSLLTSNIFDAERRSSTADGGDGTAELAAASQPLPALPRDVTPIDTISCEELLVKSGFTPVAAEAKPAPRPAPAPVAFDAQINTRGFGDVGLQWQRVNVNGSVTMIHVSTSGGTGNTTNVNVNDGTVDIADPPPAAPEAEPSPVVESTPVEPAPVAAAPEPAPTTTPAIPEELSPPASVPMAEPVAEPAP